MEIASTTKRVILQSMISAPTGLDGAVGVPVRQLVVQETDENRDHALDKTLRQDTTVLAIHSSKSHVTWVMELGRIGANGVAVRQHAERLFDPETEVILVM